MVRIELWILKYICGIFLSAPMLLDQWPHLRGVMSKRICLISAYGWVYRGLIDASCTLLR